VQLKVSSVAQRNSLYYEKDEMVNNRPVDIGTLDLLLIISPDKKIYNVGN